VRLLLEWRTSGESDLSGSKICQGVVTCWILSSRSIHSCVDQKNLKERGQQVKRMASLYSKAAKVLIWLGPESDDSPLALDLFEEIASHVKIDETTLATVVSGMMRLGQMQTSNYLLRRSNY
jgi:hypothetical protein